SRRRPGGDFNPSSSRASRRLRIEMICQDLALCDDLGVAANIFLGRERRTRIGPFSILNRRRMAVEASRVLRELGSTISPARLVGSLSGGERQLVAVARALEFQPRLFLL